MIGTTSLLSPTTEKELLKDAWTTDLFMNQKIQTASALEEDNSVLSIWEENYQDLSGWCMDPFQGRCAFPIGEFEETRHSGMKNEDYGVSIKKGEMIAKKPRGFLVEEKSLERSTLKVMELPFVVNPQSDIIMQDSLPAVKAEVAEPKAIDLNDVLLDPTESSILLRTEDWIQLANVKETNNPALSVQQESGGNKTSNIIDAEYPSPNPLELAKNEKDNWDVINTFDNTGSGAFDLLSYLCDDNIQSPEDSVSRDSGPTLKSCSSVASPADASSTTRELRNARRVEDVSRNHAEASTSSASSIAAISAALDSVTKMSRRSPRAQKRTSSRTRKDSEQSTAPGRGKKRYIDSDSEDRMSDCSYRESREKNNEASRKSRMNKKAKENEMMARASELERDNRILKMKVEELEKLVTSMRSAILRSALKKSS